LNCGRYGIKKYGIEAIFNGMTFLLNFKKIYQLVQKLLGGYTDRQTDSGDLISLTFLFKENRLKTRTKRETQAKVTLLQELNDVTL
jgi:hypothetical protein